MKNILVVDDDEHILNVVKTFLVMNGFNVITVSEGGKVYEKLSEPRPDIILLDINLGFWDGRKICKEIKNKPEMNNVPIVLFSAYHDMKNNLEGCKADDFIEKPFDMPKLVERLKELCN